MATKPQFVTPQSARTNQGFIWSLGLSLVLVAAFVAAYALRAPALVTTSQPNAAPNGYLDQAAESAWHYYANLAGQPQTTVENEQSDALLAADPFRAASGAVDPAVRSVIDYLRVHRAVSGPDASSLAPNAAVNPSTQAILDYLRAHGVEVNQPDCSPASDLPTQAWEATGCG